MNFLIIFLDTSKKKKKKNNSQSTNLALFYLFLYKHLFALKFIAFLDNVIYSIQEKLRKAVNSWKTL